MQKMTSKRRLFWGAVIFLCGILIYYYLLVSTEKTKEYKVAVNFLSANEMVSEKFGRPIKYSVNIRTKVYSEWNAASELETELEIDMAGEKDKGRADIELETRNGVWFVTKATLVTKNKERIDLLKYK